MSKNISSSGKMVFRSFKLFKQRLFIL